MRIAFSHSAAPRLLLALALLVSFAVLVLSWDLPLLEYRSFRQTQTALSSYWMATTTNWLAYPTPMFGYPWSIPFEFPLFQAIVLGVANLLPISLDQSGRLVSWVFALLTLFPLRQCVKELTGRVALSNTFSLSRYLPVAIAVVTAILVTALYIHYSDLRKEETVVGTALTSSSLSTWNYGTWEQKTSSRLWLEVVLGRAPRELLGSALVLPFAALLLAFFGRGVRAFAACLAVGYAIPFLVFANLHEVHSYYQQANGIFLLGMVACAVKGVRTRFNDTAALTVTIVLAIVMLLGFRRDFLPYIAGCDVFK